MEIQRRVEDLYGASSERDTFRSILLLGRSLVSRLGEPVSTVGDGLSTVVLPAGPLNLLVLGIPIPVFGYISDDDQEIHAKIVTFLTGFSGGLLEHGCKIVLRAFSSCQDFPRTEEIMNWLPRFRNASLEGEPALLGTELITVYPVSRQEAGRWPLGPEYLVRGVHLIELAVGELYEKLDELLADTISEAALSQSERFLFG